jgi:hypothetical protein
VIQLIYLLGTSVFWTTIAVICATLTMATLIGGAWVVFFPIKLRGAATLYLSPVLGLASLTIIASVIGRFLPLGNSIIVVLILSALLASVLSRKSIAKPGLRQLAATNLFGIVCGISVLAPLYVYGGYNASNDAFTYLAHSNWLQQHAFNELITNNTITPLNSQIEVYQSGGFRMGASYLLGLTQAVVNLQWAYAAYPAIIIVATTACCLAIGFPLSRWLCTMSRSVQFTILALPALSLGGLVFGANFGFLPQTVGLAFGAGMLFWIGPLFRWTALTNSPVKEIAKATVPGIVLFSAAIFAYSEFGPFLVLAVGSSGLILMVQSKAWKKFLVLTATLLILIALLLNTEIVRAITALRTQSGAVVGSPVEWSMLGYFAHSLGLHGGAWDYFQWTQPQFAGSTTFFYGLAILVLVLAVILSARRTIWSALRTGVLLPVGVVLVILILAFLYFRYAVASPFEKGVGQSWSQFKLADWAHPFMMVIIVLSLASLKRVLSKNFSISIVLLFVLCTIGSASLGILRIQGFIQAYPGVTNVDKFYLDLRAAVFNTCPTNSPVYLALGGQHHKFRQMATLYLYDRKVKSDWSDDIYIFPSLPSEHRTEDLATGDCVVEFMSQDGWLSQGTLVGPVRISLFDRIGRIRIASVNATYERETDGKSWWYWVEKRISFTIPTVPVENEPIGTDIKFEYQTRGERKVSLKIIGRRGIDKEIFIESDGKTLSTFQQTFDIPPSDISEIILESNGNPTSLGSGDSRIASWLIRNVTISASLYSKH